MDETNRFAEHVGERDGAWRSVTKSVICVLFVLKTLGSQEMNLSNFILMMKHLIQKYIPTQNCIKFIMCSEKFMK